MDLNTRSIVISLSGTGDLIALAQTLATGLATSRTVVLARVWMVDPAGKSLQLLGSAGTPSGGGSYGRLDGDFSRMVVGAGKIGEVALTGVPRVVRGVRGDEDWLANPGWSARQGVRAFLAYPLIALDEVVGVLAVFDREMPSEEVLIDLPFLADVAAARMPGLRDRERDTPPSHPATSLPASDLRRGQPLPPALPAGTQVAEGDGGAQGGRRSVLTRADLRRIEKENIETALARSGGTVFGPDGAAALLGMKPTTLASRIKALGIAVTKG